MNSTSPIPAEAAGKRSSLESVPYEPKPPPILPDEEDLRTSELSRHIKTRSLMEEMAGLVVVLFPLFDDGPSVHKKPVEARGELPGMFEGRGLDRQVSGKRRRSGSICNQPAFNQPIDHVASMLRPGKPGTDTGEICILASNLKPQTFGL